jgi:hypothetical protein
MGRKDDDESEKEELPFGLAPPCRSRPGALPRDEVAASAQHCQRRSTSLSVAPPRSGLDPAAGSGPEEASIDAAGRNGGAEIHGCKCSAVSAGAPPTRCSGLGRAPPPRGIQGCRRESSEDPKPTALGRQEGGGKPRAQGRGWWPTACHGSRAGLYRAIQAH